MPWADRQIDSRHGRAVEASSSSRRTEGMAGALKRRKSGLTGPKWSQTFLRTGSFHSVTTNLSACESAGWKFIDDASVWCLSASVSLSGRSAAGLHSPARAVPGFLHA